MGSRIMTHLIAGYPDADTAVACADGLVRGGATYLEIQFPFSDPTADGVTIQHACQKALDAGFTTDLGFAQVERIRSFADLPIFIMSYASLPFARGIEMFLRSVKECGANGVIIPDLMPGYDEGVYEMAFASGLEGIPVVAPGVSDKRLEEIGAVKSQFLYTALRTGITGKATDIDESTDRYLDRLAKLGKMVMAGFGITTRDQVRVVCQRVHAAIIGSELVRTLNQRLHDGNGQDLVGIRNVMEKKIRSLVED